MKTILNTCIAGFASLALSVVGLSAAAQDGSVVTEDNQVGDWLVRCVTQGEAGRNCAMITRAVSAVEQRDLAIIRVFRVPEEQRVADEIYAVQLTVPTNVNIRAGIDLQVDTNSLETIDYEICTPRNCVTTFALTGSIVSSLAGGFAGALVMTDATGSTQSATFSLDGFGRGLELL